MGIFILKIRFSYWKKYYRRFKIWKYDACSKSLYTLYVTK